MRDILDPRSRRIIQEFGNSNVLLAFDYDGVLAPIAPSPEQARIRPRTIQLLLQLTRRFPCIVISSRSQGDLLRRVRGLNFREVIGHSGLEPWCYSEKLVEEVQRWRDRLQDSLRGIKGVNIEDKVFSLAIHYRACPDKRLARAEIGGAINALGPVRATAGKQVVNLFPQGVPTKADALRRALIRSGCDSAVYVGDDETDEEVFSLSRELRLLAIHVGRKKGSYASCFAARQRDIDAFLTALLNIRRAEPGNGTILKLSIADRSFGREPNRA